MFTFTATVRHDRAKYAQYIHKAQKSCLCLVPLMLSALQSAPTKSMVLVTLCWIRLHPFQSFYIFGAHSSVSSFKTATILNWLIHIPIFRNAIPYLILSISIRINFDLYSVLPQQPPLLLPLHMRWAFRSASPKPQPYRPIWIDFNCNLHLIKRVVGIIEFKTSMHNFKTISTLYKYSFSVTTPLRSRPYCPMSSPEHHYRSSASSIPNILYICANVRYQETRPTPHISISLQDYRIDPEWISFGLYAPLTHRTSVKR